jgi:hypothetical protein
LETRVDISDATLSSPVSLGGKIDDKFWVAKLVPLEDKHLSRLQLFTFASEGIGLEVVWECFFELKGDSATHHADAVDGIDKCLSV